MPKIYAQVIDTTFVVNGVNFKMIKVEHGTFQMGDNNSPNNNAAPAHQVSLSRDYWIGETEVTQGLWVSIKDKLPETYVFEFGLGDLYPMYYCNFNDINSFCSILNGLTGMNFRLPTEAEWEFAARGGIYSNGTTYSGSDNVADVGWIGAYLGVNDGSIPQTSYPVKQKLPNELGIYDMTGNISEFVSDYYAPYTAAPQTDPMQGQIGTDNHVIIRGGDWFIIDYAASVSYRGQATNDARTGRIGFRLAFTQPDAEPEVINGSVSVDNSCTAADFNGTKINSGSGDLAAVEFGFVYGTSPNVDYAADMHTIATLSGSTLTATATNLAVGTQYYYNVYAKKADNTCVYGEESNFITCNSLDTQIENENTFNIYPNPARKQLFIEGGNFNSLVIYDVLGRKIISIGGDEKVIDVSSLPNGTYNIRLFLDGKIVYDTKIVK